MRRQIADFAVRITPDLKSAISNLKSYNRLICGYGKATRNEKVIIMLRAYCDDSASDQGKRILLLAGCVHRYNVWANFSMGWEAALAMSPSIRYFHMREARNLTGEFARWKANERDAKIRMLAELIASYNPRVVFAWVNRSEHDVILKPVAPHMLRHAYLILFYALIVKLAHWHHSMAIQLPVDFVFDEQGAVGNESVIWYHYIKSLEKPELARLLGGSPTFYDDKTLVPLQAADMVAWHIRRRKERPDEDGSKWPTAALSGLSLGEVHLSEKALVDTAVEMLKVPGLKLVQDKPTKKFKALLQKIIHDAKF